jgi:hypothetical protein
MIHRSTRALFLGGTALFLGGLAIAAPDLPAADSEAPAIAAASWYNHIGQDPNLASLRGKAILIEFWATW